MKYQIVKDKRKRILAYKNELKRTCEKARFRSGVLTSFRARKESAQYLAKNNSKGSKVKVHNRCVLTGRSKSVHRAYKLSRIALREWASIGLLSGVRKSSW